MSEYINCRNVKFAFDGYLVDSASLEYPHNGIYSIEDQSLDLVGFGIELNPEIEYQSNGYRFSNNATCIANPEISNSLSVNVTTRNGRPAIECTTYAYLLNGINLPVNVDVTIEYEKITTARIQAYAEWGGTLSCDSESSATSLTLEDQTVGSSFTIKAIPAPGYSFSYWTIDDDKDYSSTLTRIVNWKNPVYIAEFIENEKVTIQFKSKLGSSTIEDNGSIEKRIGEAIQFLAWSYPDWTFKEWQDESGNRVSSAQALTAIAETSTTYYAIYEYEKQLQLVQIWAYPWPSSAGTVEPAQLEKYEGEEFTLTAVPNSGWKFKEWQDLNGSQVSTNPIYTGYAALDTLMGMFFTAVFEEDDTPPDPSYSYAIETHVKTYDGHQTIEGDGTYDFSTQTTWKATADSGYFICKREVKQQQENGTILDTTSELFNSPGQSPQTLSFPMQTTPDTANMTYIVNLWMCPISTGELIYDETTDKLIFGSTNAPIYL